MGETKILKADSRKKENGKPKKIRNAGYLPAIVYGGGVEPLGIKVEKGVFEKLYEEAGESTLVDLVVDGGQPVKTLIYDVQRDPVKGRVMHVDFFRVNMKEKLTTEIPLNFIGESKAVEFENGALVKNMDEIEIECLPGDLVSSIDVDISSLETFDDVIRVSDIKLPKGIAALSNPDEIVASVVPPTIEVEPVVEEAAPEGEEAAPGAEAEGEEKAEEEKS